MTITRSLEGGAFRFLGIRYIPDGVQSLGSGLRDSARTTLLAILLEPDASLGDRFVE